MIKLLYFGPGRFLRQFVPIERILEGQYFEAPLKILISNTLFSKDIIVILSINTFNNIGKNHICRQQLLSNNSN